MVHTSADARAAAAEVAAKAAAAKAATAEAAAAAAAEEEDEEETEALRAMLGEDTTSDDERGEGALLGLPDALAPEPGEDPTVFGAALPPDALAELAEEQRRRGPARIRRRCFVSASRAKNPFNGVYSRDMGRGNSKEGGGIPRPRAIDNAPASESLNHWRAGGRRCRENRRAMRRRLRAGRAQEGRS
jgi:hypothetical protein